MSRGEAREIARAAKISKPKMMTELKTFRETTIDKYMGEYTPLELKSKIWWMVQGKDSATVF